MHGCLRARPWSRQYAHSFGRSVAKCLFALLVTCGSAPSGFESSATPHQTAAMRGDTMQDNVGERLAFVEPVSPPVPIQDAPEPFGLGVTTAIGEIPDK